LDRANNKLIGDGKIIKEENKELLEKAEKWWKKLSAAEKIGFYIEDAASRDL